jgi:ribosomal protein L32
MALENYHDLSSGGSSGSPGFQFEFYCNNCSRKWKSPFKPYRMGQIAGLLARFSFLYSSVNTAGRAATGISDHGSRKARDEAFAEASRHAETLYTVCSSCRKEVCADCLDASGKTCLSCGERASYKRAEVAEQEAAQSRERSANACPNCGTGSSGGRFCSECGFDMASTHKSCPSCGTMALRQARFCADCGHSF